MAISQTLARIQILPVYQAMRKWLFDHPDGLLPNVDSVATQPDGRVIDPTDPRVTRLSLYAMAYRFRNEAGIPINTAHITSSIAYTIIRRYGHDPDNFPDPYAFAAKILSWGGGRRILLEVLRQLETTEERKLRISQVVTPYLKGRAKAKRTSTVEDVVVEVEQLLEEPHPPNWPE